MRKTDISKFDKRLKVLADEVTSGVERKLRTVATVMSEVLVTGTPVDTGRARGNWTASIGVPILSNVDPDSIGEREANRSSATVRSLSQIQGIVEAWNILLGQDIIIANGVPYINKLNEGSSDQAPGGMVTPALATVQLAINSGGLF